MRGDWVIWMSDVVVVMMVMAVTVTLTNMMTWRCCVGDGDGDKCGDGDGDKHGDGDSIVSVAGSEGGAFLETGMSNNSSVIVLENTNNGIDMKDEKAVCKF